MSYLTTEVVGEGRLYRLTETAHAAQHSTAELVRQELRPEGWVEVDTAEYLSVGHGLLNQQSLQVDLVGKHLLNS